MNSLNSCAYTTKIEIGLLDKEYTHIASAVTMATIQWKIELNNTDPSFLRIFFYFKNQSVINNMTSINKTLIAQNVFIDYLVTMETTENEIFLFAEIKLYL